MPQTDPEGSTLPQGEERSEQFVLEVTEYFEKLDVSDCLLSLMLGFHLTTTSLQQIHNDIRFTLAHMRNARIVPSAIDAPPPNFVPPASGVGTPAKSNPTAQTAADAQAGSGPSRVDGSSRDAPEPRRGLQEERLYRDAWRGVADAHQRLRIAQQEERSAQTNGTMLNGTHTIATTNGITRTNSGAMDTSG